MSNSVVRAARILNLLAASEKPLSLKQIAEAIEIPKSTAHGILRNLVQESYLDVHEPASYAIGLKVFEVGSAYLRQVGAVGVVASELVRLTRTLSFTSHYAVLDAADAVYLCKEDPPGLGVQLASSIGARLPAHLTAVGKTCLAWLDPDRVAEHVRADGNEGPAEPFLSTLQAELAEIRAQGYATDEGETALGIQCIAAPVFDLSGPRGAIGVSYLLEAHASAQNVAVEVMAASARATAVLGGKVHQ